MKNVAKFLRPEPPDPDDGSLLVDLFVDRDEEVEGAIAQVDAILQGGIRQPLGVVGPARAGKSHLMLRIAREITSRFDATVRVQIATGLTDSKDVLREVSRQFRVSIGNAVLAKGVGPPEQFLLDPVDRYTRLLQPAIQGEASALEIKRAEEVSHSVKRSLGAVATGSGLVSLLTGFELQAAWEGEETRSASREQTVTIPRFDEPQLSALIAWTHAIVREAEPAWKTLLVVDDFDLLKRDDTGAFDPDPLMQALANLAREDGLFVLTTVREDTYYRHEKTFHRICLAKPFAEAHLLEEIYDRHVRLLCDGDDPFPRTFVREVAERCEGRAGVFLRFLSETHSRVPSGQRATLTVESLQHEWWSDAETADPELTSLLLRAARSAGGELRGADATRVRNSSVRRFLLEDTTTENVLRVDPLTLSFLRRG